MVESRHEANLGTSLYTQQIINPLIFLFRFSYDQLGDEEGQALLHLG